MADEHDPKDAGRPARSRADDEVLRLRMGAVVKQRRVGLGWSQKNLAVKAGLTQPQISALERGEAKPTWSTLSSLAHALGMRMSELFFHSELHKRAMTGKLRRQIEDAFDDLYDAPESE